MKKERKKWHYLPLVFLKEHGEYEDEVDIIFTHDLRHRFRKAIVGREIMQEITGFRFQHHL